MQLPRRLRLQSFGPLTTIGDIVSGVGEGQITSAGVLARITSVPMTAE